MNNDVMPLWLGKLLLMLPAVGVCGVGTWRGDVYLFPSVSCVVPPQWSTGPLVPFWPKVCVFPQRAERS